MSVADESSPDDQHLVRYLLGSLPDEEAEQLDEQSIVDGEFALRLDAVEHDLVDSYVTGELSGETLTRFESFYLSSPRRREKVRFAESLLSSHVKKEIGPVKEETGPAQAAVPAGGDVPDVPAQPRGVRPPVIFQWAAAIAAVLLLLACGYLIVQDLRLRNQLASVQTEREALQRREQELQKQLEQERSANADTARELERIRGSLAQLEQQATAGGARDLPDLHTVALVLLPQTRGSDSIATVTVPPGTDRVAVELGLESDDFPGYEAALRDPATGQIVWRSGRVTSRSIGNGNTKSKAVSVSIPANVLKPQNYIVELTGIRAGGGAELVSGYPFRVVRQ